MVAQQTTVRTLHEEDHGFVQPSSWADEYKRIYALFESNLKQK